MDWSSEALRRPGLTTACVVVESLALLVWLLVQLPDLYSFVVDRVRRREDVDGERATLLPARRITAGPTWSWAELSKSQRVVFVAKHVLVVASIKLAAWANRSFYPLAAQHGIGGVLQLFTLGRQIRTRRRKEGSFRLLAAAGAFTGACAYMLPVLTSPDAPMTTDYALRISLGAVLAASLVASLLTAPGHVDGDEKRHPVQLASPLSRLSFSWLDPLMRRYYLLPREESTEPDGGDDERTWMHRLSKMASVHSLRTLSRRLMRTGDTEAGNGHAARSPAPPPKAAQSRFLAFVPPLPSELASSNVLRRFRWKGDGQPGDSADDDADPAQDHEADDDASPHGRFTSRRGSGTSFRFACTFLPEVLAVLVTALLWIVFTFISPLSMNLLLIYVQDRQRFGVSPYLFVLGLLVGPLGTSASFQASLYGVGQLGLRLRSVIGHAVYAKLLRMRAGARIGSSSVDGDDDSSTDTVGRANNLVGTDIDTITSSLESSLQLLAVPFKLVVSLAYLYVLLSWAAFVALATIVLFIPLSAAVSSRYGKVQGRIMQATDRRVTLAGECISSMQAIKTFAWEKPMSARISDARSKELSAILSRAKVFAGMMGLSTGVPAFVTLFTFLAYTYGQGETLTASTAFTSISLFGLLREAVISSTYLTSAFMRAKVSLDRISSFVTDTEELDERPRRFQGDVIRLSEARFRWSDRDGATDDDDDEAFELYVKHLEIPKGKVTVIAGQVGSGKTALLLALLGEMHLASGDPAGCVFPARARTAYAAQEPWLQNTTIRENILFGRPFDAERYRRTVFECALEGDLETMEFGDETVVGQRGHAISGGQKSRLALARAVYGESEVVLLDDVLSAVDSGTAEHLFKHCLNGSLLNGRTVVLVTHYVDLCSRADACALVVGLKDGEVDTTWKPDHGERGRGVGKRPVHGRSPSVEEDRKLREMEKAQREREKKDAEKGDRHGEAGMEDEDSGGEGTAIEWKVYAAYLGSMGGVLFWTVYAFVNVIAHLLMLAQGAWIGVWSNADDSQSRLGYYFGVYAAVQIAGGVFLTVMYLYVIAGSLRASRRLHGQLLTCVFAAPMRWFDKTPVGRIINRFSKDMETIDTEIVESLQPVFDYGAQVVMVAVVISVILPIFLLPAFAISVAFYFVGKLYIRNALAARKNVAIARSPLFSLLSDVAGGAVTIRAFGRSSDFLDAAKRHTDRYNTMQLYEYALDRWLELRSDAVGALVAFIVGLLALSGRISPGTTGFLVSTGLEFTSRILYVVRAINKNELAFNSAHRVLEYTSLPQEPAPTEQGEVGKGWPEGGRLDVEGFRVRYDEDGQDVLKGLSFVVEPGTKIGIVGKTGCGKTTFANALLRFMYFSGGKLCIDGRDITKVNLEELRSRITMIPQDPTLFSGTIRFNLDPWGAHDDRTLADALERSGLEAHARPSSNSQTTTAAVGDGHRPTHRLVRRSSATFGLDAEVANGGHNFSLGQRQLLSLARALVRRNKLVVFDEATASVDAETDRQVQQVIREEFGGTTILTIAHRLDTIIDYDRILVLDDGRVAEYDAPGVLVDRTDSFFHRLCQSSGSFDHLRRMAVGRLEQEHR